MELIKGQEIFVNNKWWFDIVDIKDGKVHCKIEYVEGTPDNKKHYKIIKIDQNKFTKGDDQIHWSIDETWMKKEFGSLVNRIIKSQNIYSLFEDAASAGNTGGMGAVSMAGLSGSPGVPGSAGSGDISGPALGPSVKYFPKGTYGISDLSKNIKQLRKLAKKGKLNKMGVKKPLLDVLKENSEIDTFSENDFKRKLYDFLDYPWERENELAIIDTINDQRPEFGNISSDRIIQYLQDLWKVNYSFIKSGCSDQFIDQLAIIGDIEIK